MSFFCLLIYIYIFLCMHFLSVYYPMYLESNCNRFDFLVSTFTEDFHQNLNAFFVFSFIYFFFSLSYFFFYYFFSCFLGVVVGVVVVGSTRAYFSPKLSVLLIVFFFCASLLLAQFLCTKWWWGEGKKVEIFCAMLSFSIISYLYLLWIFFFSSFSHSV